MSQKLKILLLGPKTSIKHGLVGGATNSFGSLIDYIEKSNEDHRVINTKSYFGPFSKLTNPVSVFFNLIINGFWANVIFLNSSRGGTKFLAPITYYVSRICGAKFVFRPFGGDIKDYTSNYKGFSKWFHENAVLKADLLFLQTNELIKYYSDKASNVRQLITSRKKPEENIENDVSMYRKRIIYLGFVSEAKGIEHLIEASKLLGDEFNIHIYGPIQDHKISTQLDAHPELYQGILKREDIYTTIAKYDILILPTFYEGEGYPGVIIEAYAMGKPVIATKWNAISEIVQDGKTGILIEPKSTDSIVKAIQSFDTNNYNSFSKAAKKYFNDKFDEERVLGEALDEVRKLFKTNKE